MPNPRRRKMPANRSRRNNPPGGEPARATIEHSKAARCPYRGGAPLLLQGKNSTLLQLFNISQGLEGQFGPGRAETAAYGVAGGRNVGPGAAVKRHLAAGKNFGRQPAGQRSRDTLAPVTRQHVNPDLPHRLAVGRSAGQPDKPPTVKSADAEHVKAAARFTHSVGPLRGIQWRKIRRTQYPKFIPAAYGGQRVQQRQKVFGHEA